MTRKELPSNVSICGNCGEQTNDDINTMWDMDGESYCVQCYTGQGV